MDSEADRELKPGKKEKKAMKANGRVAIITESASSGITLKASQPRVT